MTPVCCMLVTPPKGTFLDAWAMYTQLVGETTPENNTFNFKLTESTFAYGGDMQDAEKWFWSIDAEGGGPNTAGTTTLAYPYLLRDDGDYYSRSESDDKFDWGFSNKPSGWKDTDLLQNCVPEILLNVYDPVVGHMDDTGVSMVARWFIRIGLERVVWLWSSRAGGGEYKCDIINKENHGQCFTAVYTILLRLLYARAQVVSDVRSVSVKVTAPDVICIELNGYNDKGFVVETNPVNNTYIINVSVRGNKPLIVELHSPRERYEEFCAFRDENNPSYVAVHLRDILKKNITFQGGDRPKLSKTGVTYSPVNIPGTVMPPYDVLSAYKGPHMDRCMVYVGKDGVHSIECKGFHGFHAKTRCIVPCGNETTYLHSAP